VKALTVRQPWASLIALDAKRIETRGWSTSHRGPLAIHAGLAMPCRRGQTIDVGPYTVERDRSGLLLRGPGLAWPYRLPLGAVVATVNLHCVTEADPWAIRPAEYPLGDYTPGRRAWHLTDVEPIRDPVLGVRGQLGLWDWRP
jgi:hypothetical protein